MGVIKWPSDLTVNMTQATVQLPNSSVTNAALSAGAAVARTKLALDALKPFAVNLMDLRVWDAIHTNLPGTAATDDLALIGNTFATGSPTIQTSDAKATTVTQYGRFLFQLPAEYDDGESVQIRVHGGMNTTVSDGTATVDLEVYESDLEAGIGSDLCTTAAQSINSLTFGDDDFSITSTGLAAGDVLDIRVTVAITDTATGTAVIGEIGGITVQCSIRG